ncbi:MAG: hypothetical protein HN368_02120 [Spirochaetales bacterium]|nr:hypothetical protein [Spirochaetales bacterium]
MRASEAIIDVDPLETVHLAPEDLFTGHWVDRDEAVLTDIKSDTLIIRVWEHADWAKKALEKEGVV